MSAATYVALYEDNAGLLYVVDGPTTYTIVECGDQRFATDAQSLLDGGVDYWEGIESLDTDTLDITPPEVNHIATYTGGTVTRTDATPGRHATRYLG